MESIIYLSILGFGCIILSAWAYTEQSRKNELQRKLDQEQYKRAELIGEKNRLLDAASKLKNENSILKEKLNTCLRVRDEKGRYIKK